MFNDKSQRPAEKQNKSEQLKIDAPDSAHEKEAESFATRMGKQGQIASSGDANPGQIGGRGHQNSGLVAPDGVKERIESTKGSGDILSDQVKRTMKSHGVDSDEVKIHTDSNANELSNVVGANAFTHGKDIYFAKGKFDTYSSEGKQRLSHELMHTKQNSLWGSPVIQREPQKSWFGEFKDDEYMDYSEKNLPNKPDKIGASMKMSFTPNTLVDATKIGLTQTVTETRGTNITPGRIDRSALMSNPIYGAADITTGGLESTAVSNTGKTGQKLDENHKYELGSHPKGGTATPARMFDRPYKEVFTTTEDVSQSFETVALGLDGKMKGIPMGSVSWGWERKSGTYKRYDMKLVSAITPSKIVTDAVKTWNASQVPKTMTTFPSFGNNAVAVYNGASGQPLFNLNAGKTVTFVDATTLPTNVGELKFAIVKLDVGDVPSRFAGVPFFMIDMGELSVATSTPTTDLPEWKGSEAGKTTYNLKLLMGDQYRYDGMRTVNSTTGKEASVSFKCFANQKYRIAVATGLALDQVDWRLIDPSGKEIYKSSDHSYGPYFDFTSSKQGGDYTVKAKARNGKNASITGMIGSYKEK